jgi:predicted acyltransferase
MNSIAAYLIAGLGESFIVSSLRIHLGYRIFQFFGKSLEPLMLGIAVMSIYWLVLFWMYRKRIFLRV